MVSFDSVRDALATDFDGYGCRYGGEYGEVRADIIADGTAEVGHLIVAEEYRRDGVGTVFLRALCDVLAENDIETLYARVHATDHDSLASLADAQAADPEYHDPTFRFLEAHGFSGLRYTADGDGDFFIEGSAAVSTVLNT
jgi:GNAT superfamily N-acetyltransferase